MAAVAEGKDPFLGARFLLVATGPAECRVEPMLIESLLQRLGLHDLRVQRRAMGEGPDTLLYAFGVRIDDQLETMRRRHAVAEGDHLAKLP